MGDIAIRVDNLHKRYLIGRHALDRNVREALSDAFSAPLRWLRGRGEAPALDEAEFWALRDIAFEVKHGEVIGILGRNGSGKSTLLKILSRITEPTFGRAEIYGHIGSLLEVGTGFHPELTGRENIYLNGAILGMRRAEITLRFDEIVAFSEIEQFLDTPVKRYSSGMYVRLAFAVAAHLTPEILLIDEVLAVGDSEFQKKCLTRMSDVAKAGRTVLFVSHNMLAVQRLCPRSIVLEKGRKIVDGPTEIAVLHYMGKGDTERSAVAWPTLDDAPGNEVVRLTGARIAFTQEKPGAVLTVHDPLSVAFDYRVLQPGQQICLMIEVQDSTGTTVFTAFDEYIQREWGEQTPATPGAYRAEFTLPSDLLNEGEYTVNVRLFSPPRQPADNPHCHVREVLRFGVLDSIDPASARGHFPYHWGSVMIRPRIRCQTTCLETDRSAHR